MSEEQNHNLNNKKSAYSFIKMNGAGNDFVIFDARKSAVKLSSKQIAKISDRKNVGCDQLIIIKKSDTANCLMEIYNSDGSKSGTCGNATRCVAAIIMEESDLEEVTIETAGGNLKCWHNGGMIAVDMGVPNFDWQKIPLSEEKPAPLSLFGYDFFYVNVGNPHVVSFVKTPLEDKEFFSISPKIESNPFFPEKTNVEFAQVIDDSLIEVRVFERGSGETLACGSGACAVAILAIKNHLTENKEITVRFKGGDLTIQWNGESESVIMTGAYEKVFYGEIDEDFID